MSLCDLITDFFITYCKDVQTTQGTKGHPNQQDRSHCMDVRTPVCLSIHPLKGILVLPVWDDYEYYKDCYSGFYVDIDCQLR